MWWCKLTDTHNSPICMRIQYRDATAAVREFVRIRMSGGVFLQTSKALPIGTELICELAAPELGEALQVKGMVTSIVEQHDESGKKFGMSIRYDPETNAAVEEAIEHVLEHAPPGTRIHPRAPTAFPVEGPEGKKLDMQDLSEGGMRLDTPAAPMGEDPIIRGTRVLLDIDIDDQTLSIEGSVVWTEIDPGTRRVKFGVEFLKLPESARELVTDLMRMKKLPTSLRIHLGEL